MKKALRSVLYRQSTLFGVCGMKCFRLVQYDLKQGLVRNWLYWLVPLCTVIVCNRCRLLLSSWEQSGTWAVYLAYCFRGMPRITRQTLSGGFQIPVLWMLMLVLPLLITLNFPFKDMKTIGSQMLLSLLLRPVYGFLFSVALLAGASYVTSPFLIGNFANLSRCGVFIDNGLNSLSGFLICIGVLFFSVGIGGVLFRKRDILPDYKEL